MLLEARSKVTVTARARVTARLRVARRQSLAPSVSRPYAVAAHARTHGTVVRRRGGARQADQSPLGADGRALHVCRRWVRETASRGFVCLRLRHQRVCAGARVSLMQWQDWRSGGRDLRRAPRGDTHVGVRVRVVAGGQASKKVRVTARARVTARRSVARRLRVAAVVCATRVERIAAVRCSGACPHARGSWAPSWWRVPSRSITPAR